jgi:hypothetical protein
MIQVSWLPEGKPTSVPDWVIGSIRVIARILVDPAGWMRSNMRLG